jgi:hypothetical protein
MIWTSRFCCAPATGNVLPGVSAKISDDPVSTPHRGDSDLIGEEPSARHLACGADRVTADRAAEVGIRLGERNVGERNNGIAASP